MSIVNITAALENALYAADNTMTTQYPNTDLDAVDIAIGTPYQRVSIISTTSTVQYSCGYSEIGYMQVDLYYPMKTGAGAANAQAQLLREYFDRGNTYTHSGVSVTIQKHSDIGPGRRENDRYVLPVRIYFYSNLEA